MGWLIKVGDKVKFKKYDETIYTVVNVEEEHVRVINSTGTQLMQIRKDFIDVVEPFIDYKQRADELEKRWSELRERLNASFENSEYFLEGFGFSDVLKLMQQLEEDNNDI
ncbi:hypothetical protein [Macrococcus armenti]|uniref:hypothetical protein n=1 Tax=Macrococcus armenti TaxID=2875764 RepID=UPI001CCC8859|nr:hypothetical protein [Macrococcus armenti]UBH14139.1 hypothetical protein LAU43_05440 [Macrococcus armenti]